jgi:hypothetical protein
LFAWNAFIGRYIIKAAGALNGSSSFQGHFTSRLTPKTLLHSFHPILKVLFKVVDFISQNIMGDVWSRRADLSARTLYEIFPANPIHNIVPKVSSNKCSF